MVGLHGAVETDLPSTPEYGFASNFETKLASIPEIAVVEAIQKSKAGDSIKPDRHRWNANGRNAMAESKIRNLNMNEVNRKRPSVSAAENN